MRRDPRSHDVWKRSRSLHCHEAVAGEIAGVLMVPEPLGLERVTAGVPVIDEGGVLEAYLREVEPVVVLVDRPNSGLRNPDLR